ncbi:putative lipoprotein [Flavobacterium beibuense]|uniref:Putative lipoprotein n=2 Tax=Flavobacterium beibuense TaxID=657326 RepID=A0A444WD20_9FLAO|nr:putative lipoprotein [Flavobacterium beibuense]
MTMKSRILNKFIVALSAVTLITIVACDYDYNEIGSDLVQGDIHHNGIEKYTGHAIAYDKATGPVQTNNMPLNTLGVYNNPAFGKTISHFVSQVKLASVNPTLTTPTIDTVYLYIPYFSDLQDTDSDGESTYTIDSIFGNAEAKIKLSIYENGFYLRSSDPGSDDNIQKYYSNDRAMVEANKGTVLLNNSSDISENAEFKFSAAEIDRKVDLTDDGVANGKTVERKAPGIYLQLNKEFFQQKLFGAPAGSLVNNNVFIDYFRGLYFNVEQIGNDGAMAMLDFSQGKIEVFYNDEEFDTDGEPTGGRIDKTMTLNLSGNTINLFDNTYNDTFLAGINTSDEVEGDERLYVKGGEGSLAFINILDQADLDFLKPDPVTGERVLINEANLTFYVDKTAMTGSDEPLRLYLYDVKNRRPVYDYYIDQTTNAANNKYNRYVYDGIISYDEDDRGLKYKVRITQHINNIVNKDSTNFVLGLAVTENINQISNAALRTPFTSGTTDVKSAPVASVISASGTVLYGSKSGANVPEDKRLKLEIYYTKPTP